MPIDIDPRRGSGELSRLFLPYGISTRKRTLEFGDFAFTGKGPNNCSVAVAVERKRLDGGSSDLIDSIQSKRLSGHQLPGLVDNYDYGYLVVEGVWRPGVNGELEIRRPNRNGKVEWVARNIHVHAVINYIFSLALRAGVLPWRTYDDRETVNFVVGQYNSWQKPWEEHRAHDDVYAPDRPRAAEAHRGLRLGLVRREVGTVEKMLYQAPGLDQKARFAAQYFKSAMFLPRPYTEEEVERAELEWANVEWWTRTKPPKKRKIGKAGAKEIVGAIKGR